MTDDYSWSLYRGQQDASHRKKLCKKFYREEGDQMEKNHQIFSNSKFSSFFEIYNECHMRRELLKKLSLTTVSAPKNTLDLTK